MSSIKNVASEQGSSAKFRSYFRKWNKMYEFQRKVRKANKLCESSFLKLLPESENKHRFEHYFKYYTRSSLGPESFSDVNFVTLLFSLLKLYKTRHTPEFNEQVNLLRKNQTQNQVYQSFKELYQDELLKNQVMALGVNFEEKIITIGILVKAQNVVYSYVNGVLQHSKSYEEQLQRQLTAIKFFTDYCTFLRDDGWSFIFEPWPYL